MIRSDRHVEQGDVAEHYDELDVFYRELWGEHLHHGLWIEKTQTVSEAVQQLVALVAAEARISAGSRVCDAGSGYGATARQLARAGATVTAVTLSPRQHQYACTREAATDNPTYLLGDWLTAPFEDDTFDAVVAIESTEHMADQQAFFDKAQRVLRPGGRLVVCAWLAKQNPSAATRRWLLEPICRDGRLACLATMSDYVRWIEQASLDLTRFHDISRKVRRTWPVSVVRLGRALARDARYRHYLFDRTRTNRRFVLAVPRIMAAYYMGVMRYGIFTVRCMP